KNSTAINKTNNKRIPVPDPGVPALPETDTSTPSPSTGHHFIHRFKKTGKMQQKRFNKKTAEEQWDNEAIFLSDWVLQDAPV
ncbi:hypothetical protein ACLKA6_001666, partial [Drosophila palustris]